MKRISRFQHVPFFKRLIKQLRLHYRATAMAVWSNFVLCFIFCFAQSRKKKRFSLIQKFLLVAVPRNNDAECCTIEGINISSDAYSGDFLSGLISFWGKLRKPFLEPAGPRRSWQVEGVVSRWKEHYATAAAAKDLHQVWQLISGSGHTGSAWWVTFHSRFLLTRARMGVFSSSVCPENLI